jgi:hypothetical protein
VVFKAREQIGTMVADPCHYIHRQSAIMGATFDDLQPEIFLPHSPSAPLPGFSEPFGELESQQFTKKRPDADAGKVIAPGANVVSFLFIESIIWTIQSQLHEPRKGDNARAGNLFGNNFSQFAQ